MPPTNGSESTRSQTESQRTNSLSQVKLRTRSTLPRLSTSATKPGEVFLPARSAARVFHAPTSLSKALKTRSLPLMPNTTKSQLTRHSQLLQLTLPLTSGSSSLLLKYITAIISPNLCTSPGFELSLFHNR